MHPEPRLVAVLSAMPPFPAASAEGALVRVRRVVPRILREDVTDNAPSLDGPCFDAHATRSPSGEAWGSQIASIEVSRKRAMRWARATLGTCRPASSFWIVLRATPTARDVSSCVRPAALRASRSLGRVPVSFTARTLQLVVKYATSGAKIPQKGPFGIGRTAYSTRRVVRVHSGVR